MTTQRVDFMFEASAEVTRAAVEDTNSTIPEEEA